MLNYMLPCSFFPGGPSVQHEHQYQYQYEEYEHKYGYVLYSLLCREMSLVSSPNGAPYKIKNAGLFEGATQIYTTLVPVLSKVCLALPCALLNCRH